MVTDLNMFLSSQIEGMKTHKLGRMVVDEFEEGTLKDFCG
jgi:hypothetical protein